jgi:hypothetical protein
MIKDDELIGQVLLCPKCGSSVKIYAPDEFPTPPLHSVSKPTALRRFPNVLVSETPSGVIGDVNGASDGNTEGVLSEYPQDIGVSGQDNTVPVSDEELKSRRYAVSVLFAVLAVLTGLYLCIKLFGF